jgi:TolB-like protein
MRRWICGLLCLMIVAVSCSAWAEFKKTKIAVLDFDLQGKGFETKDMGAIVAEWFTTALVRTGRFDVIERALLKKIVLEQKLGMTGLLDESTASKIGKLLGVKAIISGSVVRLQNVTEINARIIDVETASIKDAESVRSTSASGLQDLVEEMSQRIIKKFPLEGYLVQRDGDTVAIDLGRAAGVRKGMQFAAYREGNVIRHPKTGAVLYVQRIETGRFKITDVMDAISVGVLLSEKSKGAVAYGQPVYSLLEPLRPETARLFVSVEPGNARIRILNIEPPFEQGIRLDPGRYQLEVSADGYRKETQWITLEAGSDKNLAVQLAKIESEAPSVPQTPSEYEQTAVAPPQENPSRPTARLSPQVDRFVRMLLSGQDAQIRLAAREAMRRHPHDPRLLGAANDALLAGYLQNTNNGVHIDAMAWLCKFLGNSQDASYLSTLKKVSTGNVHHKLKSYAQKSYDMLSRKAHPGRRR